MPPTQRAHRRQARPFNCKAHLVKPKVFVGDLAPEELEEIGPDAAPLPNPSWTPEQYRTQMLMRGVVESAAPHTLGIAGFLELAERFGILEKRPTLSLRTECRSSRRPWHEA